MNTDTIPNAYQKGLNSATGNVNATTGSISSMGQGASGVLTSVSKPMDLLNGLLSWLILIVLLFVIYLLVRGKIKKTATGIWGVVSGPFKKVAASIDVANSTADQLTMSEEQLSDLADDISACWHIVGDSNKSAVAYICSVRSHADWRYLCHVYGKRKPKRLSNISGQSFGLVETINLNLGPANRNKIMAHLRSVGVPSTDNYYRGINR